MTYYNCYGNVPRLKEGPLTYIKNTGALMAQRVAFWTFIALLIFGGGSWLVSYNRSLGGFVQAFGVVVFFFVIIWIVKSSMRNNRL